MVTLFRLPVDYLPITRRAVAVSVRGRGLAGGEGAWVFAEVYAIAARDVVLVLADAEATMSMQGSLP